VKNYSKGREYIDKCLNNMYIRNNFIFYDFPIYSIIIPAYNCENSIYYPIISIQNQNISQYEIILINDLSKDNTSKVIQILAKNDKRIKIINNKKNLGTLYSRCIGTLISKGKYIFPLDNDDMLFEEDIFDYLYKVTKEFNYDIIGFRSVNAKSYSEKIRRMKDSSLYI
jgi:glycosyltransferase involved in cell wall biosynthesis